MNILELFYNILFHPSETFKNAETSKPYKLPLFIVLFAAIFLTILSGNKNENNLIFLYILQSINLIIYWLFFSFFVDLAARMFGIENKFNKLLTLISFSFIPWIFLAPLKLLKNSVFSDVATILILFVWFWTIALQMLGISETYNIPRKNAIIILLLPFLGTILYFTWLTDFFVKLFQISWL